mmetsp:Transcript_35399/g.92136  ORF Transcript_35399/g.92136 Transcript_35399/m.92136 type:complete len:208 (-) Transcript_35399:2135-2758(-)
MEEEEEGEERLAKLEHIADIMQRSLPIQSEGGGEERGVVEAEIRTSAFFPLDVEGGIAESLVMVESALAIVGRGRGADDSMHAQKWHSSLDGIARIILPDEVEDSIASASSLFRQVGEEEKREDGREVRKEGGEEGRDIDWRSGASQTGESREKSRIDMIRGEGETKEKGMGEHGEKGGERESDGVNMEVDEREEQDEGGDDEVVFL